MSWFSWQLRRSGTRESCCSLLPLKPATIPQYSILSMGQYGPTWIATIPYSVCSGKSVSFQCHTRLCEWYVWACPNLHLIRPALFNTCSIFQFVPDGLAAEWVVSIRNNADFKIFKPYYSSILIPSSRYWASKCASIKIRYILFDDCDQAEDRPAKIFRLNIALAWLAFLIMSWNASTQLTLQMPVDLCKMCKSDCNPGLLWVQLA